MKKKRISRSQYIKEIKQGIEVYSKQRAELLDTIRKYGGRLTEDEFDSEFEEYPCIEKLQEDGSIKRVVMSEGKHPFGVVALTGETFWLGSLFQGEWAKWLSLLQLMCEVGEAKLEKTPKGIVYSIPNITLSNKGDKCMY